MAHAMLAERCDEVGAAQEVKINLRARKGDRDLIDRAATITNKTRTEFMLESSRQAAMDALLDQTFFSVTSDNWDRLIAILNAPVKKNHKFASLMNKKAPWEK